MVFSPRRGHNLSRQRRRHAFFPARKRRKKKIIILGVKVGLGSSFKKISRRLSWTRLLFAKRGEVRVSYLCDRWGFFLKRNWKLFCGKVSWGKIFWGFQDLVSPEFPPFFPWSSMLFGLRRLRRILGKSYYYFLSTHTPISQKNVKLPFPPPPLQSCS